MASDNSKNALEANKIVQVTSRIICASDQGCPCFLPSFYYTDLAFPLDVCAHFSAVWMLVEVVQGRRIWIEIYPALYKRRVGTLLHAVTEVEWEKKDL